VPVKGLQTFKDLLINAGYKFDNLDVSKITVNDFVEQALANKK
jgi:hypothetical protein